MDEDEIEDVDDSDYSWFGWLILVLIAGLCAYALIAIKQDLFP